MRIALPISRGRISPVFDVALHVVLVEMTGQTELARKEVALGSGRADEVAERLREWNVELLICSALSQELRAALQSAGIQVKSHICGDVESVLAAYKAGGLQDARFVMPGCCRRRRGRHRGACGCQIGATLRELKFR